MERTLLVTREVLRSRWQIRQPVGEATVVLGWRTTQELEIDDGPAPEVALIMARAFTAIALVTFPLAEPPKANPVDWVRVLTEPNPLLKVRDRWERIPATFYMVSTRSPQAAAQLFDDGRFSWTMQTTLALLGSPDAPPPELIRAEVLGVCMSQSVDFGALEKHAIIGAVLPGVDGDMALLACRDRETQGTLLAAIEREARAAGYDWRVCSAEAFTDAMADGAGPAVSEPGS